MLLETSTVFAIVPPPCDFVAFILSFFLLLLNLFIKKKHIQRAPLPPERRPFLLTFSLLLPFSSNHEFTLHPVQLYPLLRAGRIKGLCFLSIARIRNPCAYALCLCGKDRICRDIELLAGRELVEFQGARKALAVNLHIEITVNFHGAGNRVEI